RQGGQPRPVRYVSDGRSRGTVADVRGNPVADRPAPGTTRAGMTGNRVGCGSRRPAELRRDHGKAASFGAARQSIAQFWPPPGRLRSNSLAAGLDDTENRTQQAWNRGMSAKTPANATGEVGGR